MLVSLILLLALRSRLTNEFEARILHILHMDAPCGVHVESMWSPCQVCDAFQSYIWEPVLVKESALNAATEAACLILSIDETVKNPQLGALGTWRHFETRMY